MREHSQAMRERVLALSGMVQCVHLAHKIALRGICPESEMSVFIGSLFEEKVESATTLYGKERMMDALRRTRRFLAGESVECGKDILLHVILLMALERKLASHPEMLAEIASLIQRAQLQAKHFHRLHPHVLATLAEAYGRTASKLAPKIVIHGKRSHLEAVGNKERIRALLLSGIRAAHLWRKYGGNRWHLLLKRNAMAQEAERILKEIRLALC